MHILLVTICYPPEIRSVSTMMQELAEELVARGHRVTVLTSWPQYNLSEASRRRPTAEDTMERGVRVIRVKTLPTHKIAYLLRGVAQVLLPQFFIRALRRFVREPIDAVFVQLPHLPLGKVGAYVRRQYGARFVLNVHDIFPQNAIDLGILRNSHLIAFFERMERDVYTQADAIATHTTGGRQFLVDRKGVLAAKITYIPNWIDVQAWDAVQPTGAFRTRYGLNGKFVFLFAGILGPTQHLDVVLGLARRLRDIADLRVLVVGDGTERARLMQKASALQLTNVRFEGFVDPSVYPALVKEMDCGLVCLGSQNRTPTVPGKIWGFMAAGLPILAFLNSQNEGLQIIRDARCGYACQSDDLEEAERLVRKLVQERDQLPALGQAGRAYAAQHYGKRACIDRLEQLIVRAPIRSPSTAAVAQS